MKSTSSHFLRRLSQLPFIRLFMAQPARPTIPFLFPIITTTMDTVPWATSLLELDHATDACYIDQIEYGKCKGEKHHEFLLIHIVHLGTGARAKVRIDRAAKRTESEISSSNGSRHSSEICSSTALAYDKAVIVGDGRGAVDITRKMEPFDLLSKVTYPTRQPTLTDLSTLLIVVHEHAPNYDVVDHQCYWFAHTVWQVLCGPAYGAVEVPGARWERRGKYGPFRVGKDSLEVIKTEHQTLLQREEMRVRARAEAAKARDDAVSVVPCPVSKEMTSLVLDT